MGLVPSPWRLLAVPAAFLLGFRVRCARPGATSFIRSRQGFALVRLVTLPLSLFSAAFYPLGEYPEWLRRPTPEEWITELSLGRGRLPFVCPVD